MARPLSKRSIAEYQREIEGMSRLRTAITIDSDVTEELKAEVRDKLDIAVMAVCKILKIKEEIQNEN
jgi:hypothetical protein